LFPAVGDCGRRFLRADPVEAGSANDYDDTDAGAAM
jgi:hypothetical protein